MDDHNGDLFLLSLLDRLNLTDWPDLKFEKESVPFEKYEQLHLLGDEFLTLLLALVMERNNVGVGQCFTKMG
jgi:hypothetical protein